MGIAGKTYKRVFLAAFILIFAIALIFFSRIVYKAVYESILPGEGIEMKKQNAESSPYYNLTPASVKAGVLDYDETWNGVVLVKDDFIVPSGKTLTISPGTIIKFSAERDWGDIISFSVENYSEYPRSKLVVYGNLVAEGEPDNLIVFTSDELYPEGGDWLGILFKQDCFSEKKSSIKYSIIEYGLKNIVAGYADKEFCPDNPLVIENSIIRHANKNIGCREPTPSGPYLRANGIEVYGFPTIIRGNIIYDNFKGIGNDFPSLIEHNIIAMHNQPCWGDAPGTGIRTTGIDSGIWEIKENVRIRNNLFFRNAWAIEMDGFAPSIIKNNIFLSNNKGILIFRWGDSFNPTFFGNDFYGNKVDRAASKTGSNEQAQVLKPDEVLIDPEFSEEDFWNADFIPRSPKLDGLGPDWNWSWIAPEMMTRA